MLKTFIVIPFCLLFLVVCYAVFTRTLPDYDRHILQNQKQTIALSPSSAAGIYQITPQQWLLKGMETIHSTEVDLCDQKQSPQSSHLIPLYGGLQYPQLNKKRLLDFKNALLDDANFDIPAFKINGFFESYDQHSPFPTALSLQFLNSESHATHTLSDSVNNPTHLPFNKTLWISWYATATTPPDTAMTYIGDHLLTIERTHLRGCDAGKLVFSVIKARPNHTSSRGILVQFNQYALAKHRVYLSEQTHQASTTTSSTGKEALFQQSLQHKLIQFDEEQQQFHIAPPQLKNYAPSLLVDSRFADIPRNDVTHGLLKALHQSAQGRTVLQAVQHYNHNHASLFALRSDNVMNAQVLSDGFEQFISDFNINLLPERFIEDNHSILTPWQSYIGQQFQVVVNPSTETHLYIIAKHLHCATGEIQPLSNSLYQLTLQKGQHTLTIEGEPLENLSRWITAPTLAIAIDKNSNGDFILQQRPHTTPHTKQPHKLAIYDRNGQLIDPSSADSSAYWGHILGVSDTVNGLYFLPEQLQKARPETKKVVLSIDHALQKQSQDLLTEHIQKLPYHPKRRASLTLLNANGEIMAAAQYPHYEAGLQADRMELKRNYAPSDSALTFQAGYHDNSSSYVVGSVLKLLTAIALESQAIDSPDAAQFLEGLSLSQMIQQGQTNQFQFHPKANCYPQNAPCFNQQNAHGLKNFLSKTGRVLTPFNTLQPQDGGRFGIRQAIRGSINSYFAYAAHRYLLPVEQGEQPIGIQKALSPLGYAQSNALFATAAKLGFFQTLNLSGNLLHNNQLKPNSILLTTPSELLPPNNVEQFLRNAIGERNRVTPLQLAQLAFAIYSGTIQTPTLMLSMDQKVAKPSTQPLNINLQRIRDGMHEVIQSGTAHTAFANNPQKDLIFAKTGTTSLPEPDQKLNNALMIGFHLNGTIFVCAISHLEATGGSPEGCGGLINQWFLQQYPLTADTPQNLHGK